MSSLQEAVDILPAGWGFDDTAAVVEAGQAVEQYYIRGDTGYLLEKYAVAEDEVEVGARAAVIAVAAAAVAGGQAAREAEIAMG